MTLVLPNPIEEVATFLCRSRREMCNKIAELERTGEALGALNTRPLTQREAEAIIIPFARSRNDHVAPDPGTCHHPRASCPAWH